MAARDVVLISVLLFALGLGLVIVNVVTHRMVNEFVSIPAMNSSAAAVAAFQSSATTADRLDYVMFGIFIGLVLALMITAWYVGGEPVFMFIYFLMIVVGVAVSMVLANTWEDITTSTAVTGVVAGWTIEASFPITNHIVSHLPMYMAVIGILGIMVTFSRPYLTSNTL